MASHDLAYGRRLPRISAFYGMVVDMYFADHAPPHFHARYAEHEALIAIENGAVIAGALPRRAQGFVREWLELHRDELRANWTRAQAREPLERIDPLP